MEKNINLSASDVAIALVAGTNPYEFSNRELVLGLGREVRPAAETDWLGVRFYGPRAHEVRALLVGRLRGLPGSVTSQQLGLCSSTEERAAVIAAAKVAVSAIDAELARRYSAREEKNATTVTVAVMAKKEEKKAERYARMRAIAARGLSAAY